MTNRRVFGSAVQVYALLMGNAAQWLGVKESEPHMNHVIGQILVELPLDGFFASGHG
jgi:hypothetical protein